MPNLALVAIGGAIGSVFRYLLGTLGATWLGGAFPWPTILINIAGSAVIGFVAASTVPNGLLPNSPALRALVMVGICGGFTTFSSFSLQTLDLIRDGRLVAASANVLISVFLCLAGVAAGHYGADGIRLARISHRADTALHAGARILAVLEKPDRAVPILAAARRLVDAAGRGGIHAIAIAPLRSTDIAATEDILPSPESADGHPKVRELRERFDDWHRTASGIEARWSELRGSACAIVAARGAQADLVVLGRSDPDDGERRHGALHAAIFDTHRPVLMIPHGEAFPIGRTVAIAWTDDRATRSAVRSALPLLRQADRVVLLVDGDQIAPSDIGISADRWKIAGEGPPGERLLSGAGEAGADLLVTGAYRDGPLRERLFGGPTLHLLENAAIPLLMRH